MADDDMDQETETTQMPVEEDAEHTDSDEEIATPKAKAKPKPKGKVKQTAAQKRQGAKSAKNIKRIIAKDKEENKHGYDSEPEEQATGLGEVDDDDDDDDDEDTPSEGEGSSDNSEEDEDKEDYGDDDDEEEEEDVKPKAKTKKQTAKPKQKPKPKAKKRKSKYVDDEAAEGGSDEDEDNSDGKKRKSKAKKAKMSDKQDLADCEYGEVERQAVFRDDKDIQISVSERAKTAKMVAKQRDDDLMRRTAGIPAIKAEQAALRARMEKLAALEAEASSSSSSSSTAATRDSPMDEERKRPQQASLNAPERGKKTKTIKMEDVYDAHTAERINRDLNAEFDAEAGTKEAPVEQEGDDDGDADLKASIAMQSSIRVKPAQAGARAALAAAAAVKTTTGGLAALAAASTPRLPTTAAAAKTAAAKGAIPQQTASGANVIKSNAAPATAEDDAYFQGMDDADTKTPEKPQRPPAAVSEKVVPAGRSLAKDFNAVTNADKAETKPAKAVKIPTPKSIAPKYTKLAEVPIGAVFTPKEQSGDMSYVVTDLPKSKEQPGTCLMLDSADEAKVAEWKRTGMCPEWPSLLRDHFEEKYNYPPNFERSKIHTWPYGIRGQPMEDANGDFAMNTFRPFFFKFVKNKGGFLDMETVWGPAQTYTKAIERPRKEIVDALKKEYRTIGEQHWKTRNLDTNIWKAMECEMPQYLRLLSHPAMAYSASLTGKGEHVKPLFANCTVKDKEGKKAGGTAAAAAKSGEKAATAAKKNEAVKADTKEAAGGALGVSEELLKWFRTSGDAIQEILKTMKALKQQSAEESIVQSEILNSITSLRQSTNARAAHSLTTTPMDVELPTKETEKPKEPPKNKETPKDKETTAAKAAPVPKPAQVAVNAVMTTTTTTTAKEEKPKATKPTPPKPKPTPRTDEEFGADDYKPKPTPPTAAQLAEKPAPPKPLMVPATALIPVGSATLTMEEEDKMFPNVDG